MNLIDNSIGDSNFGCNLPANEIGVVIFDVIWNVDANRMATLENDENILISFE